MVKCVIQRMYLVASIEALVFCSKKTDICEQQAEELTVHSLRASEVLDWC